MILWQNLERTDCKFMNSERSPRKVSGNIISFALALAALVWIPVSLIANAGSKQQSTATTQQTEAKQQAPSLPQAAAPGVKTADQGFMNVEVLSEIPADQLLPAMRYMTFALGVRCDYCHVQDNFESDERAAKKRAREMMKMMFAMDNGSFGGHREVTCYTCHRGVAKAADMPTLADVTSTASAAVAGAAAQPSANATNSASSPAATSATVSGLPSVQEIISKYTLALGGEAAIQKFGTRVDTGSLDATSHNMHSKIEIYRKAPDKVLTILHGARGDSSQGYNGTVAWQQRGEEVKELSGDDLARAKDLTAFNPGLSLMKNYARLEVKDIAKIDGHDAYRIIASRSSGTSDQYYFDAQSGLLLRISTEIDSPLGAIPQDVYYEDYRDVSGVKVPFLIRVVRSDGATIYKWEQIQANVPVEDNRFEKPTEKPKEAPAPKH
jgi:photosynthetic reaction center cytochrome c subunit